MSASIQVLTRAIQLLEILPRKDSPMCLAEIAEASGLPKSSAYPVSKAGLIMFTKCLAVEYAAEDIRANAFCPGQLLTDMNMKRYAREAARRRLHARGNHAAGLATVPLGRIGTPRDVGLAAAFLVSDASAYMTGQALNVTGGKSPSSSVSPSPKLSDGLSPEAAFPVFLGFSFRLPCILHQQAESRPMKPHETAFPCETPRLSFRMAGPSCTEGMVRYWPHSAAVTEAGAYCGPCQGMHEGINGGGRKAGSQSQEKGLFASPFFPRKPGTPSAPLNAPPQPQGMTPQRPCGSGLPDNTIPKAILRKRSGLPS